MSRSKLSNIALAVAMTPEQIKAERKAFKAWARGPHGFYRCAEHESQWSGWLARAEQAQRMRDALAAIVEHLLDGDDYSALQVARGAGSAALKEGGV